MFKQHLLFLQYNKNVECIVGKDRFHICKVREPDVPIKNNNIPSYEPYIPRINTIFYSCTNVKCEPFKLTSMIQLLAHPISNLRYCYLETADKYTCESVKYHYYKNIDKLLFLANNIPTNKFYFADCLLYSDGERVCHRKNNVDSHAKLVDTGTIVRPKDDNILSQDELLCEETNDMRVNCDFNLYVPYPYGLKEKKPVKIIDKILLKTGSYVIPLKLKCIGNWCGYSGKLFPSRRSMPREAYDPPGGSVYRCYYAKKQQICKKLYGPLRQVYNEREWLII